jgi:ferric-dicitrate binding protein FerR (iron transport regulator)
MSIDPLQEKLADYLGDEMTAVERRQFERELTQHPELEQEAEQLRLTLAAMRGQWARPAVPTSTSAARWNSMQRRRASWWRYAAAAMLAFAGGFIVRGFWPGGAAAPVAEPQAPRRQAAIVEAYLDAPAGSQFARILMALAQRDRPAGQSAVD